MGGLAEGFRKFDRARRAKAGPRQTLKAASWLRPYRGRAMLALLALVAATVAELAVGLGVRGLIDGGLRRQPWEALGGPLGVFVMVGAVYAAATYCLANLVSWLGERVVADIRKSLFDRVVGLDPGFYETNKTAEVLSRLVADTTVLQTLLVATSPSGAHSLLLLLGSSGLMAVSSPRLAGIVLAALPVIVLPAAAIAARVRRFSRDSQERLARVAAIGNESLRAIKTVQAFAHENLDRAAMRTGIEDAFAAARLRFRAEALLRTVVVGLLFALVAGVLIVGARDVAGGRMTPGELTAFVIYAVLAATSFGGTMGFYAQVQRAAGAVERISELSRAKPAVESPAHPVPLPVPARGAISFEAVSFSYPGRPEVFALNEFSLNIAPGETVALVGPSGAGKTTVFDLLLRFYDQQSGRVLLDGIDIRLAALPDLRSRIALVSQEPEIFSTTVAENIRYGNPRASDEEVRAAAEDAAAVEFIAALPQGFETHLGEQGVRLSGGQRQRLAIARALIKGAAILLFDEATSALDSSSERQIQLALQKATAHRTALLIAHRLATVQIADRIVVMDGGRSLATGTHAELVEKSGLYAEYARLQLQAPAAQSSSG